MHWPSEFAPCESWYSEPAQLIDVMPTILDVSGATHPQTVQGNKTPRLDGVSLRPVLKAKSLARTEPIFIEHENNTFVRDGDWKLVGRGVAAPTGVNTSKWELYNIAKDRTETNDLAKSRPRKVKELAEMWNVWAKRCNVYPKVEKNTSTTK